jgi:hypothetical protein
MRTRSSLVYLTLLPWVATTSFFAARRVPVHFWLDLWPILPFIATAFGALFVAVGKRGARPETKASAETI